METIQKLNTLLLKLPHFLKSQLKFSWIKQLYDNLLHPRKIILSCLIDTYLRKNIKLHSNLNIPANKIKSFPIFDKQIFER